MFTPEFILNKASAAAAAGRQDEVLRMLELARTESARVSRSDTQVRMGSPAQFESVAQACEALCGVPALAAA